jgi:hypothetical protein
VTNLTLIAQIKNGGDPSKITAQIEAVLYHKSQQLVEQVKLQEAAALLEASPVPAVWKDHEGNPIIPKPTDWSRHYEEISASHVKAQLQSAKERWEAAETRARETSSKAQSQKTEDNVRAAKHAQAELKNLRMNISAGERALKQKMAAGAKLHKAITKKQATRAKTIHDAVKKIGGGAFRGSPMMGHVVNHVADAIHTHLTHNPTKK